MILIDGQAGTSVPSDDRGFAYGDGLFETLRWADGRAPWLARHHARLVVGCAALGFDAPPLAALTADLAAAAGATPRAVARIVVTRGSGGRGYAASRASRPRRVVSIHPWPELPLGNWREGVRVRWCTTRLAGDAPLPGVKHLNRLTQVLARAEWDDPDIAEGLLCDADGAVIEATAANLFAVVDGALVTPPIGGGAVAGVARGWVLERAGALVGGAAERVLRRADLERASELFLTNAVVGLWPVRELAGRTLAVGPVATRLGAALAAEGFGP